MVLRNPDMGVYSELEINGSIKAHANTSDIGAYHSYKQVKFVLATCNSTPMEKDLLCCCCVLHKHRKKGRPCHWFLHPKGVVCSVTVWSPPSPSSAFSQVNLRAFCHCNPLWTPPEAGMNEAIHIWNPSSLGKETGHWLHRNHMNISGHWRYTNCLLEPTYLVSASQDEGQPCVFFQTHDLSLTSPAVLSNSLSCFYIPLCFALVYNLLKVTQTKVVLY